MLGNGHLSHWMLSMWAVKMSFMRMMTCECLHFLDHRCCSNWLVVVPTLFTGLAHCLMNSDDL